MSLKDVFSLIDDKLKDVFHTQKYDPAKDREKLVKRLEATKQKFLQTEPAKGRKDFRVANSVVEFSPTLPSGEPMNLGDKPAPYYVPSERFTGLIDNLVKLTNEKAFDDQLQGKADSTVTKTRRVSNGPRKPRSDAGAGWSEERRAKFAATVAARKAGQKS